MEKMRGLIIWEDGHASLEEMALPEISEYQALVKVTAGALCGTDMKIIHNNLKGFADYPTILGHEGVGRIVKTGSKVRNFEIGDKVVLPYIFNPIGSYYSTWGHSRSIRSSEIRMPCWRTVIPWTTEHWQSLISPRGRSRILLTMWRQR